MGLDVKAAIVTWVGHADALVAIASRDNVSGLAPGEAEGFRHRLNGPAEDRKYDGRLLPFVKHCSHWIDHLYVLCDYGDPRLVELITTWLREDLGLRDRVTLIPVELSNKNDYAAAYTAADQLLRTFPACTHLGYYVAPGTTAMRVALIFLAKTRYPGRLFHLPAGSDQAEPLDLPFDLEADFLPYLAERRRIAATSSGLATIAQLPDCAISGTSRAIVEARTLAYYHAQWDFDVLIHGESGTGKDVFARVIHHNSRRLCSAAHNGFFAVNCAEFSPQLLTSELFGHTKGAFTDASTDKVGVFERASGGTLFLDEIGECSLELQASLLRVLQPVDDTKPTIRRVRYVGGAKEVDVDVRLIAATNRDLRAMVDAGTFRLDLYQRISSLALRVPSLSERREDIPALADDLLEKLNASVGRSKAAGTGKSLTIAAKRVLKSADWPGNVRGVLNILRRAFVMTHSDVLDEPDIVRALQHDPFGSPAREPILERTFDDSFSIDGIEAELYVHYIDRALRDTQGNISRASKLLNYPDEARLRKQIARLRIDVAKYKLSPP